MLSNKKIIQLKRDHADFFNSLFKFLGQLLLQMFEKGRAACAKTQLGTCRFHFEACHFSNISSFIWRITLSNELNAHEKLPQSCIDRGFCVHAQIT